MIRSRLRPVLAGGSRSLLSEYAIDVAKACRARDLRTVAVTSGYVCPEPRAEFYRWMDAANVDLKGFTERFYRDLTGGRLEPVLDTLRYLRRETEVWLEVTTLLIPGENDADEEIDRLSRWVCKELGPDVPLHFTAFHPAWRMLGHPPTPLSTVRRARRIAIRNGLRYVYTGNVLDAAGATTTCHACGASLVARSGYALGYWGLTDSGECRRCATRCAGVFAGPPARWGARVLPVHLRGFGEETAGRPVGAG